MSAAKAATTVLTATKRESGAKSVKGKTISGVIYGKTQKNTPIAVDSLELQKIYENLGHSSLFNLNLEGESEPISVLLHEIQKQPNSNDIIHFDLYAVTKGQKVQTDISIQFEGEPVAQADSDKIISTVTDTLQIQALPSDLPDQITLDISDLTEIGDSKLVSDIKVPHGVEVLTEADIMVIKVDEARTEQELEEDTEEVGEDETTDADDEDSTEASKDSDSSAQD